MYVCSQSRRTRRDRTRQASYGYVLTHTGLVKKQGGYAFGCACVCVCVCFTYTRTHTRLPSVSQAHDDLGEKKRKEGSAREDEKKSKAIQSIRQGSPSPSHRPGVVLSYPILSYPILSYPVLSCPVLPCADGERRRGPARPGTFPRADFVVEGRTGDSAAASTVVNSLHTSYVV